MLVHSFLNGLAAYHEKVEKLLKMFTNQSEEDVWVLCCIKHLVGSKRPSNSSMCYSEMERPRVSVESRKQFSQGDCKPVSKELEKEVAETGGILSKN